MACTIITYDLCVSQNASFKQQVNITDTNGNPVDISTWFFDATIKEYPGAMTAPISVFDVNILSMPSASIELILEPSQSALLVKKKYYYDVIGTDTGSIPNDVYRVLQGKVNVNLGVTDL